MGLLTAAASVRQRTIWEIQLTRIAVALGDENLADGGAARPNDPSKRDSTASRWR
jgi:hypothetical protein